MSQSNLPSNPFDRANLPAAVNAGAVAIESERAIAEAQGQMMLAKRFPRDLTAAHAELMEGCKLPALANVAFYSVPRGGGSVSGPSIRLAEEIARVAGNIEYGHRELSRNDGKSEVEVYAWDKQTNVRSIRQITVLHVTDTKQGPKHCRDQKDIDDLIANKASKQLRGRILAIVPKWLVEAAIEECKKTLTGTNDQPISVRVRQMTQAFAKFGVTVEHLSTYLKHGLDDVTVDELVDLTGVFNAIKEGARASDYFGANQLIDAPVNDNDPAKALKTPPAPKATAKQQPPTPPSVPHETEEPAPPQPRKAAAAKAAPEPKVESPEPTPPPVQNGVGENPDEIW